MGAEHGTLDDVLPLGLGLAEVQAWLRGVRSWRLVGGVLHMGEAGRPIVVGQAPGRGQDEELALGGRTGSRLRKLLGIPDDPQFRREFDAFNVLPRWPGKAGKGDRFPLQTARGVAARVRFRTSEVLLLGRAAEAFGVLSPPFVWVPLSGVDDLGREAFQTVVSVPHPSGVNRWWNEPGNTELALGFFADMRGRLPG